MSHNKAMFKKINTRDKDTGQEIITKAQIKELGMLLSELNLKGGVEVSRGETIIDPAKFIISHLSMIRIARNSRISIPYYDRLRKFIFNSSPVNK